MGFFSCIKDIPADSCDSGLYITCTPSPSCVWRGGRRCPDRTPPPGWRRFPAPQWLLRPRHSPAASPSTGGGKKSSLISTVLFTVYNITISRCIFRFGWFLYLSTELHAFLLFSVLFLLIYTTLKQLQSLQYMYNTWIDVMIHFHTFL